MPNQRTIAMPDGAWAENAETNIPLPPVPGTAYRNPVVNLPEWRGGQRFEMIVDSSKWNQLFYLLTNMVRQIEQMGVPVWSPQTNYVVDSIVMGVDGVLYQAVAASGPSSVGAQPPPNSGFWEFAVTAPPAADSYALTVNDEASGADIVLGDLNDAAPVAPAGRQNVKWQRFGDHISASVPSPVTLTTNAPLTGGGSLDQNRTLGVNAAGAATSSADGTAGVVQLAADNAATTERGKAATPAGVAAMFNDRITYGTAALTAGTDALTSGVVYLQYE